MRRCESCDNTNEHFHTITSKLRHKKARIKRLYPAHIGYRFSEEPVILNKDWLAGLKNKGEENE